MTRSIAPALARSEKWGRLSVHVINVDRQQSGNFAVPADIAGAVHPHYQHSAARAYAGVPSRIRPTLLHEHQERYSRGGDAAALDHIAAVRDAWSARLPLSATEEDIRDYAERRAAWMVERMYSETGPIRRFAGCVDSVVAWVRDVLMGDGINPPDVRFPGLLARVTSARWWVRKLRNVVMRRMEGLAIRAGMVHVRAGVYVSDESVIRRGRAARRNAAALAAATATNEIGQEYGLDELAALGVANPEIRFGEMVTRAKGVEEVANDRGWSGYFATITCPSAYHARLSPSGAKNPAYSGASPKDAQVYLTRQWGRARAKLAREGVGVMGLRVVEPHHDGTPHWHMLVFCRRADADIVRDVMRAYAMQESTDEPGAAAHRFGWEAIDYRRGSAVGYVLKYISKSIDGRGMDADMDTAAGASLETGVSAAQGAERVTVWARTWGIRQFQFFGVPTIGPWRELRRVRELQAEQLSFFDAWNAADTGEFGDYMHAVSASPIEPIKEARASIYPGEVNQAVTGVKRGAAEMVTRVHTWVIKWRGAQSSAPRTCVNNCTEGVCDGRNERPRGEIIAIGGGEIGGECIRTGIREGCCNGNHELAARYGRRNRHDQERGLR